MAVHLACDGGWGAGMEWRKSQWLKIGHCFKCPFHLCKKVTMDHLLCPTPLMLPSPISTSPATLPSATPSPSPAVAPPVHNLPRSEFITGTGPAIQAGTSAAKLVYSTASQVENTPQNNECNMVELRGAQVASFTVHGCELICLPQAFDLFLKHLVGGLHTVYTKLKRLEITPVVCNVEQVRILRGLGAIQPGVNRCKLISRKDFQTLYNDCTNASSRPGRPPKRSQSGTSQDNQHMMLNSISNLMSPGIIPPTGLERPFMMMPHPLIPVSLPPASVTMAMSQMTHLNTITNMAATVQPQNAPSIMVTSVIKERRPGSPSPVPSVEDRKRSGSHTPPQWNPSVSNSPARTENSSDRIPAHQNEVPLKQALLRLSPSILPTPKEGDLATHNAGQEAKVSETQKGLDEALLCIPAVKDCYDQLCVPGQALPPGFPSPPICPDGLSSIETLLTNIQGLLKVAIDNARAQEKQVQLEKTELKMELYREREQREALEKHLAVEQKNRAILQKRLKKEKKTKRKLQEALEYECRKRDQVEQRLKQTPPTQGLRGLSDSLTQDIDCDRNGSRTDVERTIQDGRLYLKTSVMY